FFRQDTWVRKAFYRLVYTVVVELPAVTYCARGANVRTIKTAAAAVQLVVRAMSVARTRAISDRAVLQLTNFYRRLGPICLCAAFGILIAVLWRTRTEGRRAAT